MRAYVYREKREWGKLNATITPEYKTWKNMYKYWLKRYLEKGVYKIELYYNWENRYKTPDCTFQIEIL